MSHKKRLDCLRDMNMKAAQLEEENHTHSRERKKTHDAQGEIEKIRIHEETTHTELLGEMSSLESKCRNLDNELSLEDQRSAWARNVFD